MYVPYCLLLLLPVCLLKYAGVRFPTSVSLRFPSSVATMSEPIVHLVTAKMDYIRMKVDGPMQSCIDEV